MQINEAVQLGSRSNDCYPIVNYFIAKKTDYLVRGSKL